MRLAISAAPRYNGAGTGGAAVKDKLKTRDLVRVALAAALIAVCAWITVPAPPVPVSMQVFAIFFALGYLGGKRGTVAVLVYLLLGAVGVPVFSGFGGGLGALLGPTGGYLFGFLFSALLYWLITARCGEKLPVTVAAMVAGLLACYAVGTLWFLWRYGEGMTLSAALATCVVPFLPWDAAKLALAVTLSRLVKKYEGKRG